LKRSSSSSTMDSDQMQSASTSSMALRQLIDNQLYSFIYGKWRLDYYNKSNRYHKNAPLWLLGQPYFTTRSDDEALFSEYLLDYYSRIWLTYRTKLSPLPDSNKTSDCGWGCTLRTCQMMLAQTLTQIWLGRDWRFSGDKERNVLINGVSHYEIVSLFGDSVGCELGLYRLMSIANGSSSHQRAVGSWFSPSNAFALISECSLLHSLRIYSVNDGMLIESEVDELSNQFRIPILVIVHLQLGCASTVNQCYHQHLIKFFSMQNSVGIIGGHKRRSLYFIGSYNNDSLIYLDPHIAHEAMPAEQIPQQCNQFHCNKFTKMSVDQIEPGCSLGFVVLSRLHYRSSIDFLVSVRFTRIIDVCADDRKSANQQPLFVAYSSRPELVNARSDVSSVSSSTAAQLGFELI
uniref:Cysteine protease n=1 Tax=Anisakis simplex TaxID=6269 RepID=A0A0M3J2Y4_ANISI